MWGSQSTAPGVAVGPRSYGEGMTTGPTITAITLGVRDVEAARDFYVDGLGFRLVLHQPREIAFVQCAPGQLLALWDVAQMPSEYGAVGPAWRRRPCRSATTCRPRVRSSSCMPPRWLPVPPPSPAPQEREWGGVSACVADLDGFRWDVVHNPNFRVDADGTVHLGAPS